jgi:hypothetical protein
MTRKESAAPGTAPSGTATRSSPSSTTKTSRTISSIIMYRRSALAPATLAPEVSARSILSARLFQLIEDSRGIAGVKTFINCGRGDDNYFVALYTLAGINRTNFDIRLRALLQKYLASARLAPSPRERAPRQPAIASACERPREPLPRYLRWLPGRRLRNIRRLIKLLRYRP